MRCQEPNCTLQIRCRRLQLCAKHYSAWYRINHTEKYKETVKKSYTKHHTQRRAQQNNYYSNYYKRNKQTKLLRCKHYRNCNKTKFNAAAAKHRVLRRQALPKWLSKEELKEITLFYKGCPKGYHVDHIIPIAGKTVSGLHVLSNLQYLPAADNLRKSNKF